MPFTLTMPKLSPTMEEGTIAKWHKKEGDYVEAGELLLEVNSDKATVEFEALDPGFLRKILIQANGEAIINQPIAIFTKEKNESIDTYQPEGATAKGAAIATPTTQPAGVVSESTPTTPSATPVKGGMVQAIFVPEPPLENYEFNHPRGAAKGIIASPLARKIANEKGLDITTVKGTGPGGRILSVDLERAQPSAISAFGHREEPKEIPGSFEDISLTPMRKVVGQRLQESKTFIPHFYVTMAIDVEPVEAIRNQLKEMGTKLTINDFVIRACALALKQHPQVNRGFNSVNNTMIQYKTIDISIAVSVDGGLITPIIRHADFKNLGEISVEVKQLAKRAREGKLDPVEFKGGSFTISNLGMFGVKNFIAVINPPQAAILAVSGIQEIPVVKGGQIVPGKTMEVCLSSDHRVIDGVLAAQFLQTLKKILENPAVLLV
jgi:pyruvate dehydrogenase E2 component (dihydrolipoamide acetyltransferase)